MNAVKDWLAKILVGLVVGLLTSYLLFHSSLARLEGKVDALTANQQTLMQALLQPDRTGPVNLREVE